MLGHDTSIIAWETLKSKTSAEKILSGDAGSVCANLEDHGIAMSVCLVNGDLHAVAERLFEAEDVSVLDAALVESGFTSTSGFYRAFSGVTGKKPRDVRSSD